MFSAGFRQVAVWVPGPTPARVVYDRVHLPCCVALGGVCYYLGRLGYRQVPEAAPV